MLPPLLHCAEKPWDDEACVGLQSVTSMIYPNRQDS